MTVAETISSYAASTKFEDLSKEAVGEVHRLLLDNLAITIGGFNAEGSRILRLYASELGGPAESTIVGSGLKTSCLHATLVNGAMLRYLDAQDTYWNVRPGYETFQAGRACENTPALLALGERQHSSGREVATAMFLSYELTGRFCDAVLGKPPKLRGWHHSVLNSLVAPVVLGKLLGLTAEQGAHAMGIAGCHNATMNILDTDGEENNMTKNVAGSFAAQSGLTAAFMARKGYTGPLRIIEGKQGFVETVVGGECDLEQLEKGGPVPKILGVNLKPYCADYHAQGTIEATLHLAREHGIRAEDVASVKVTSYVWTIRHLGDPGKIIPSNKESADHSLPYIIAMTLIDRAMGPDQYSDDNLRNPRVLELINKVTLEIDQEMQRVFPVVMPVRVEIRTRDGSNYVHQVDYPRGHHKNPMTDDEVQRKFRLLAGKYMHSNQMNKIIGAVYGLEELEDIGELMEMLVF